MEVQFRKTLILLLTPLLLACSDPTPVPPEKMQYVGLWVSSDRYISIFANGHLEYRKKLALSFHNRTSGNFTFKENSLKVMFVNFTINKAPYTENGQWQMVMNEILYTRTGPPVRYGKSTNWPEGIE